jgi:flagellar protein FliS
MERKDLITKADFISKTSAILMHLRDTLDLEIGGEVAQNMFNLYDYMIQRLNDAHVNNDLKLLDEVSSLLTPIRDAWVQIPETAKQEAFEAQRQNRQAM